MTMLEKARIKIDAIIKCNEELLLGILKEEYEDIECYDTYNDFLWRVYESLEMKVCYSRDADNRIQKNFKRAVEQLPLSRLNEEFGSKLYNMRDSVSMFIHIEFYSLATSIMKEYAYEHGFIDALKTVQVSFKIGDLLRMKQYMGIAKPTIEKEDEEKDNDAIWDFERLEKELQKTIDNKA